MDLEVNVKLVLGIFLKDFIIEKNEYIRKPTLFQGNKIYDQEGKLITEDSYITYYHLKNYNSEEFDNIYNFLYHIQQITNLEIVFDSYFNNILIGHKLIEFEEDEVKESEIDGKNIDARIEVIKEGLKKIGIEQEIKLLSLVYYE